jgi:hypothetical protein
VNPGGYIKVHRSMLEDGWYQSLTDRQKLAWLHLLMVVNWTPSEFGCRKCGKMWDLPAGAAAKSFRTLAALAGVSEKVMRGMLEKGVAKGTVKSDTRAQCHSVYTIVNWDKYQAGEKRGHREGTEEGTERARETAQRRHVNKKGRTKKGKNEEWAVMQEPLFTSPPSTEDEPPPKAKKKPKKPAKRAPWQHLLDVYYQDREELDGKGPQLDWRAKDKAIAQALLKGPPTWTVEELAPLIRKYNRMDDDYVREAGYPWAMFPKKINKLRIGGSSSSSNSPGRGPVKGAPDRYTGPPPRKSC